MMESAEYAIAVDWAKSDVYAVASESQLCGVGVLYRVVFDIYPGKRPNASTNLFVY